MKLQNAPAASGDAYVAKKNRGRAAPAATTTAAAGVAVEGPAPATVASPAASEASPSQSFVASMESPVQVCSTSWSSTGFYRVFLFLLGTRLSKDSFFYFSCKLYRVLLGSSVLISSWAWLEEALPNLAGFYWVFLYFIDT